MKFEDFSNLICSDFWSLLDSVQQNEKRTPLWLWEFMQRASTIKSAISQELEFYEMGVDSVPFDFVHSATYKERDLEDFAPVFERIRNVVHNIEEGCIDGISWVIIVPLKDIMECAHRLVIACRAEYNSAQKTKEE